MFTPLALVPALLVSAAFASDANNCGDWLVNPPNSSRGSYVVATVEGARSERAGQRRALNMASREAWANAGYPDEPGLPRATAEKWCIEPKADAFQVSVLAFLPSKTVELVATSSAPGGAQALPPADSEHAPDLRGGAGFVAVQGASPMRPMAPSASGQNAIALTGGGVGPMGQSAGAGGLGAPGPGLSGLTGPLGGPATGADVQGLLALLQAQTFDHDRLVALNTAIANHTWTVAQVARVLPSFSFSPDRLRAAEMFQPRVSDPQRAMALEALLDEPDRGSLRQLYGY